MNQVHYSADLESRRRIDKTYFFLLSSVHLTEFIMSSNLRVLHQMNLVGALCACPQLAGSMVIFSEQRAVVSVTGSQVPGV